ncbi:hypothetical protein ABZP36_036016 [Zizania latifolia]
MLSILSWSELARSGNYAASFAYVGIEQTLERYRMKKDYINGDVAGFAAGANVLGFRER